MVPVNYWAVVAAAVFMMILGAVWYGPLFGKKWAALMGFALPDAMDAETRRKMLKSYGLMALGALVMSFSLSHALTFASAYLGVGGVYAGLQAGFWNWLGFIVPVTMGTVLWEDKPWTLWFINVGYYLLGLLSIGVLLAIWM